MHAASYYISFTELHACAATDQGVAFIWIQKYGMIVRHCSEGFCVIQKSEGLLKILLKPWGLLNHIETD